MNSFQDIANGASVLLDANTVIYHFIAEANYGPVCTELLKRIQAGALEGYLPLHLLAEVAHRLMTIEACQKYSWPYAGIANRLRQHPTHIQQLHQYSAALQTLATSGVKFLPITLADTLDAARISRQSGLLTNDSIAVAVMHNNKLTLLASNDADFDRVPGITRFAPV